MADILRFILTTTCQFCLSKKPPACQTLYRLFQVITRQSPSNKTGNQPQKLMQNFEILYQRGQILKQCHRGKILKHSVNTVKEAKVWNTVSTQSKRQNFETQCQSGKILKHSVHTMKKAKIWNTVSKRQNVEAVKEAKCWSTVSKRQNFATVSNRQNLEIQCQRGKILKKKKNRVKEATFCSTLSLLTRRQIFEIQCQIGNIWSTVSRRQNFEIQFQRGNILKHNVKEADFCNKKWPIEGNIFM
jgi:hypothetical protein